MNHRIFQARPKLDETHRNLGLVEGRWYFWDANFKEALGGYIRFDQAELHMRQMENLLACKTGNCED